MSAQLDEKLLNEKTVTTQAGNQTTEISAAGTTAASTNAATSNDNPPINPRDSLITYGDAIKSTGWLGATIGVNLLIGTAGVYVNTIMLSHIDNEGKNLEASNLINTYQNVVMASSSAMLFSVSSVGGTANGTNDFVRIKLIFRNGIIMSMVLSIASAALILPSGYILKGLNQRYELADIAQDYFQGYVWGIPALSLLGLEQQISFGTLNILPVNIFTFSNAALTAGLGSILIYGKLGFPELGARGLGHANSLSAWLSLLSYTLYIKYSNRFRRLDLISIADQWFDRKVLAELYSIGGPIGLQVATEFGSLIAMTAIIGSKMSHDDLKTNEVGMQYLFFSIVPIYGIGQACSILTGLQVGQKNYENARKLTNASLALGTGLSLVTLGLFSAIPHALMSPFLNVDDPRNAEIVLATRYLIILNSANQILDSIRIISAGGIQGAFSDTGFALKTGAFGLCVVAIPVGAVLGLPAGLGVIGIYLGRSTGLLFGAAAVLSKWCSRIRSTITANLGIGYTLIDDEALAVEARINATNAATPAPAPAPASTSVSSSTSATPTPVPTPAAAPTASQNHSVSMLHAYSAANARHRAANGAEIVTDNKSNSRRKRGCCFIQ